MIEEKLEEDECSYCLRAKEHARVHGKDDLHVLCKAHRITKWYAKNAYNEGNVEWRNPLSADSYNDIQEINANPPILPQFNFSVIAEMEGVIVEYDDEMVFIKPVVLSDVIEGEYVNRRFAIMFAIFDGIKEKFKWGVLEKKVMDFIHYIGLQNMRGIVDTCVFGKAIKNRVDDDIDYYTQRIMCDDCCSNEQKRIVKIFDNCWFEVIEKNSEKIELVFHLDDYYKANIAELEPVFTETLYKNALEFCELKDSRDFFQEYNKLEKTIEITIKI